MGRGVKKVLTPSFFIFQKVYKEKIFFYYLEVVKYMRLDEWLYFNFLVNKMVEVKHPLMERYYREEMRQFMAEVRENPIIA